MECYTVTKAKKAGRHIGVAYRNSDRFQIVDIIQGDGKSWPYYSIGVVPKDNNAPVRRFETIQECEQVYTLLS